ncbi:pitrilysin family protein [Magnetovibrio sp. PR-2]|uniref:M16 family metallopeptidase n=1 Tax=Magnetovibrio sp. PR-2 TaxID=3120356 RepID=UPI002FCE476F
MKLKWLMAVFIAVLPVQAFGVDVQRVESDKGIVAWLVEDHSNPVVAIRFAFLGGSELDPVGKKGLANLAASTMDEGAGEMDSQMFQQTLTDQSITLRFEAGYDRFSGRIKTLTENLDRSAELMNLALTQPRFDQEPVARLKSQIISGIRSSSERPGKIAYNALYQTMFDGHGYAHDSDGTVETVEAITQDDLKAFVRTRLGRENLIIGVTGDVTAEQLKVILDQAFGNLPGQPAFQHQPHTQAKVSGKLEVIERDIPQSTIVFGQAGLKRQDPDYYAVLVMNHILGGGSFTSRLYDEVREKRGLAYSVGTGNYPMALAGVLIGSAATENARVAETVDVIRTEWARMANGDITEAELTSAKNYVMGSFPLTLTSTDTIARVLVSMQINDLGLEYLDRRKTYIGAVSRDDVNRVARTLLKPDALDIIIVGRPAGIVSKP